MSASVVGLAGLLFSVVPAGAAGKVPASKPAAKKGGVVTFAESPNYSPTWILPFYTGQYFTIQEQGWFENLMWPPLFNQGNGKSPEVNFTQSLGNKPVYTNGGKTVTLTIKHWRWSTGDAVTVRDLTFWINLLKANETQWANYTPGGFPTDVTAMKTKGTYTLVLTLTKSYASTYYTLNELSQITPIPQHEWDRESATGPVGNYDETPTGAKKVLAFLETQSKDLKTYATNPLWQVVDGPFKLSGYTLTGKVTLKANASYSGPTKPKIAEFVQLPYTSTEAEYNALRAGQLTVGYIPANDSSTVPAVKSLGYNVGPWEIDGFNSLFANFNNPTVGSVFDQLYIRQALEDLIDQPLYISKVWNGYAQPDYGPVVNGPPSLTNASVEPDTYPYDPSKAKALLKSHGWAVHPGGTTTCQSAGTGPSDCGSGIKGGQALTFNLLIYSGNEQEQEMMTAFKTAAATVGITIKLQSNSNVFAASPACTPTQADCTWQIAYWGGAAYTPPTGFPVGSGYFDCKDGNNHENYCSQEEDALDTAAEAGSATAATVAKWEKFVSTQLPMLWMPNSDFEIVAAKSDLVGPLPANATLSVFPQAWYFKK